MARPQRLPPVRRVNRPWRWPSRNLVTAGVALVLAFLATAGLRSWNELQETRERERELETRIVEAERRIADLFDHVKRLDDDPLALEREARRQLGLVRTSDVVIVLPSDEGASPAPRQGSRRGDSDRSGAGSDAGSAAGVRP